ncbi:RDD family protein [Stenoxybacter acetivorans]|uniref:RDD family protein n=1 Tax=Stenoxybacter acetivorans TaxID=422441 RepID=UPI000565F1FA|nr:RDD family protein [Stenoxybacter acetivorans]
MALSVRTQIPEQELEVELASAGERIGAYVLNNIINMAVLLIPFAFIVVGIYKQAAASRGGYADDTPISFFHGAVLIGVLYIPYCIWQLVWMSKYGQSIGKRIVGIKVIKSNGENPGFVGTVLLREVVFILIVGFIASIIGFVAGFVGAVSGVSGVSNNGYGFVPLMVNVAIGWTPWLICLIMLFQTKTWRRTLQDYLAGTLVVKAEKKR